MKEKETVHKQANENIERAISRLQTALKYGSDMNSSKLVCVEDAETFLRETIKKLIELE